ncbi:unnamed protein product, partial [marine sediment metagenome]
YDPNQGLWMDPQSGQAFVPTFTNVQDSNIQGEVESQMGGPAKVDAQPYLVSDKGQGAMPGPGEQNAPQRPDARDPWAMAQEHTKSNQFKNELYREMFGRDPQSGFRDKQERERFYSGIKVSTPSIPTPIDNSVDTSPSGLFNDPKNPGPF